MRTILALVCLALVQIAFSLTFKIDAHREECFYENIEREHVKVLLQYQVSSGGFLDIDLHVYDPSNSLIHKSERESEGKITFNAEKAGHYKFCFSNMMSTVTTKTVSFNINVGDLLDPNLAKLEHLDPIEKSIMRLSEGLSQIQNEQKYLRLREMTHRDVTEQTCARLLWWSIFEVFILVFMSVFQVWYLRRFFEVKTKV
jgi:hypothetical protein